MVGCTLHCFIMITSFAWVEMARALVLPVDEAVTEAVIRIGEVQIMFSFQSLTRRPLDISKLPPVIISVAITGGNHGKEANPNLPESPEEQAISTYEAYKAGASLVHIHRRRRWDNPAAMSTSIEEYHEVNRLIRGKCPDIIINNTGGGGAGLTIEEKLAPVYAKPEIMSIDLSCFPLRMTYRGKKATPLREG